MLNRKTFIGIVAMALCAQTAFGASVKTGGGHNTGGTLARAGSLRASAARSISAAQKKSVSTSNGNGDSTRAPAVVSGSSFGTSGKINKLTQSTANAGAALTALEERIQELADKKMDADDFASKFDDRAQTTNLATTNFVEEAFTVYDLNTVERKLQQKIGRGDDFAQEFDTRFATKPVATTDAVSSLTTRVAATESDVASLDGRIETAEGDIQTLKDNPGTNPDQVNTLITKAISTQKLTNETYVGTAINSAISTAEGYADTVAGTAETNAKNYADSIKGMTAEQQEAFTTLSGKVDTNTSNLALKADKETLDTALKDKLCSNPTFVVVPDTSSENGTKNVTVKCGDKTQAEFSIDTGGANAVCAVEMDVTANVVQDGKTGQLLNFRDSCNTDPNKYLKKVFIPNGDDGLDSCSPAVSNSDANGCYTITEQTVQSGQCSTNGHTPKTICPECPEVIENVKSDSNGNESENGTCFTARVYHGLRNSLNQCTKGEEKASSKKTVCNGDSGQDGCPAYVSAKDANGCYYTQVQTKIDGTCTPTGAKTTVCPECPEVIENVKSDSSGAETENGTCFTAHIYRGARNSLNQCTKGEEKIASKKTVCNGDSGQDGCPAYVSEKDSNGCYYTQAQTMVNGTCTPTGDKTTVCPECPEMILQTKVDRNGNDSATGKCSKIVNYERGTRDATTHICGTGIQKNVSIICDGTEITAEEFAVKAAAAGLATETFAMNAAMNAALCPDGNITSRVENNNVTGKDEVVVICESND